MTKYVCLFCRKGPSDGVSIFRINAKGQPGVWACREHKKMTDAPRDDALDNIVRVLEPKP